jgi:ankyrin repeat protein
VRALVEKGADLNAKDNGGQTALMKAVWMGRCNADVVRFLIEKGADVNAYDKNGYTALMTAANQGFVDIVRALVEKGADLNAQDNGGQTALMKAVGAPPHADVVRILIEKGANLNVTDKFANKTALGYARFLKSVGKADFWFGPEQEREIGEIVRMLERAGAR